MRVTIVGTGSSGNCLLVEAAGAGQGGAVLVDAGFRPDEVAQRLARVGAVLRPGDVAGIVLTHHHGDHACGALSLARALGAPVFLHDGVVAPRVRRKVETRRYAPGAPFAVGPFSVEALPLPHDAAQMALRVEADGAAFGVVTDLGSVPAGLPPLLRRCDAALVEANYCPDLLERGPYPPKLRARVAGPFGHLSNGQTAELAARLGGSRLRTLVLGHVSAVNNHPDRALAAVVARAGALAVEVVEQGEVRRLEIVATQLALSFGAERGASLG